MLHFRILLKLPNAIAVKQIRDQAGAGAAGGMGGGLLLPAAQPKAGIQTG